MIIYGLCDPRTNAMRYVGKTTQRLQRRITEHMRDYRHRYQNGWMHDLRHAGLRPVPVILDTCQTHEELNESEQFWIAAVRAAGARLLNGTDGGDGCSSLSEEARAKIRAARAKQVIPPEVYAKRSEKMRGRKRPKEVIDRCVATRRANHPNGFSVEMRMRMREVSGHARRVRRLDTGEVFASSYAASRALGKSNEAVRICMLNGRRCGGTYWEWVDARRVVAS